MKRWIFACAFLFLAGCASSEFGMQNMAHSRQIDLEDVDQSGVYKISVMNTIDIGWDGGDRADREKVVKYFLKDKCSRYEILTDVPLVQGTYLFTTKPRIKYVMRAKCV